MEKSSDIRLLIRSEEFRAYYDSLPIRVKEKYDYVLSILAEQYVVSEKFVKKIESSDLYEARISVGNNEYRTLLFAIDSASFIACKRVILLNSFLKKDSKQYKKEIQKALTILTELGI